MTLPLLIYDADCRFCERWVERIKEATGSRVGFAPYQEVAHRFPNISIQAFENAVQWIEGEGEVYGGAKAAFRLLSFTGNSGRLSWWLYRNFPPFAVVSEAVYHQIAQRRRTVSRITGWLWGPSLKRPTYRLSANIFPRFLAAIYLVAFVSLWVQIDGLIGSRGIWPVQETVSSVSERLGPNGIFRYPTLFWFGQSDLLLHLVCGGGAALSLISIFLPASWPVWFLLWASYLSLVTVGGAFLSFQWDVLLLEVGFLTFFALPFVPRLRGALNAPSRSVSWLYRWLLFRFMFASGVVKLTSGDATWRNLSALTFHYETQPLPTWIGWYVHQLPDVIHIASTAAMFVIELAVPFLIFGPRRPRLIAFFLFIGFQINIALTGNYNYFNLLTMALCLWLVDDASWPRSMSKFFSRPCAESLPWPRSVILGYLTVVLLASANLFSKYTLRHRTDWPGPINSLSAALAPFRMINTYGLFQVMTKERPEIIIEGSMDGVTWQPYDFRYKPGNPATSPSFVAPHQPRLDWQMWFAALGGARQKRWFHSLAARLLEGSPPVLDLLAHSPFPEDDPPNFLRAQLYNYRFTTYQERAELGIWWKREHKGVYLGPVALK